MKGFIVIVMLQHHLIARQMNLVSATVNPQWNVSNSCWCYVRDHRQYVNMTHLRLPESVYQSKILSVSDLNKKIG